MDGTRRATRTSRGKSWQRRGVPLAAGVVAAALAVLPSGAHAASVGGGVGGGAALSPVPAGGYHPPTDMGSMDGISRRGRPHTPRQAGAYNPATDMGSMYDISRIVRANTAWQAGYTGKGVDIALIDSGVSPVPGLTSGNVVNGPDLSFDSQRPGLTNLDGYGHGTHMASIIVGRDAATTPAGY